MTGRGPMGAGPHHKEGLGIPPGRYKTGRPSKGGRQPVGWIRGRAWWKQEPSPPLPPDPVCPAWQYPPDLDLEAVRGSGWLRAELVPLRTWGHLSYFTRCTLYHPTTGLMLPDGSLVGPGEIAAWTDMDGREYRIPVTPEDLMEYGIWPDTFSLPEDVWASTCQFYRDPQGFWAWIWPNAVDPEYPEAWESQWSGLTTLRAADGGWRPSSPCEQTWTRKKAQAEFPEYVYGVDPVTSPDADAGRGYMDWSRNGAAAFDPSIPPANPQRLRNAEYEIPDPPDYAGYLSEQGLGGIFSSVKKIVGDVLEEARDAAKQGVAVAAATAPAWALAASGGNPLIAQGIILGTRVLSQAINGDPGALAQVQAAGLPADPEALAQIRAMVRDQEARRRRNLLIGAGVAGAALVGAAALGAK